MTSFGLKQGQDKGNWGAYPPQECPGVTPPPPPPQPSITVRGSCNCVCIMIVRVWGYVEMLGLHGEIPVYVSTK